MTRLPGIYDPMERESSPSPLREHLTVPRPPADERSLAKGLDASPVFFVVLQYHFSPIHVSLTRALSISRAWQKIKRAFERKFQIA